MTGLPLVSYAAAGKVSPLVVPGPPPPPELIRVLVVDDDARVRAAIRETIALEVDLLSVGDAADAATAVAIASTTASATASVTDSWVALVDVLLPDAGTGLALISRMSRRPGCSVVAMSVRSGLALAALAAGAVAFVEKGDDIDAILQSVRSAGAARGPA
jgi:DNA-binding NtrC family response regulator